MELRSKKRIINTRQLPGYTGGTDGLLSVPTVKYYPKNFYTDPIKLNVPEMPAPDEIMGYKGSLGGDLYKLVDHNYKPKKTSALQVGQTALDNLGEIASTYGTFAKAWEPVKGVDEMLQDAGTSSDIINGIAYTRQKGVDGGKEMQELKAQNSSNLITGITAGAETGGKIGSTFGAPGKFVGGIVGGIGGFVNGILGGKHRERELRKQLTNAQRKQIATNSDREASAITDYLQQNYAKEHGNPYATGIYGAEKGKDAGIYIKPSKRGTFTAAAKARGMGVQEFASKVLANKDDYSTAMVKKANFARNASKWADGKDEGYYSNPYKSIFDVYTSEGLQKGQPNSKVAKGETILDNINSTQEATGSLVRRGKEGVDTELANLGENTIVLGGQLDWRTGISFKDQAKPYTQALEHINKKFEGRGSKYGGVLANNTSKLQQEQVNKLKQPIVEKLQDLAQQQQYQHQVEGYNEQYMVKRGKDKRYPGFASGKPSAWDSIIPNSIGLLAAIDQYRDAASQDVYKPNTYARNTYAGMALPTLAGIRLNGQEIQNQLQDQARWANYGIEQSGGLTGGQKLNAKLANYANLRKQSADSAMKLQETNNKYLSNWAENALRYGAVDAENRLKANQFDEEMFANAHAAKLQGKQMGMLNFMKFLEQLSADNAKRKQFNSMYNLYVQDQKIDKDKLNAYIENMQQNRQINSNQVWNPFYKPSQMELLLNTLMRSLKAPTVKYIKK